MKFLAKNFKNRSALEKAVFGKDASKDSIEGTREELAQFGLSDRNTVHGLKVVISDTPTPEESLVIPPQRGDVKKGAILGK